MGFGAAETGIARGIHKKQSDRPQILAQRVVVVWHVRTEIVNVFEARRKHRRYVLAVRSRLKRKRFCDPVKVVTIVIYRKISSTYVVDSVVCRLVVYFKNCRHGHKPTIGTGQYNIETIENDSKQSRAKFYRFVTKHSRGALFKNDGAC